MRELYPPISRRISDIYTEYYQEKGRSKCRGLIEHAMEYADALDLDNNFTHFLDIYRFQALVKSYYLDVIRYKEYHFNKKREDGDLDESIDCYSKEWSKYIHENLISKDKAASLTANWIMKYSPIHIHADDEKYIPTEEEATNIIMANSGFAIDNSIAIMDVELEKVAPGLVNDLEYHFLYRPIDERHLFLVYGQILASSQCQDVSNK